MNNFLSIESASAAELHAILALATEMKATRGRHAAHPLRHQCWALIFSKSSTRTRVSFEVGIRELAGDVLFLSSSEIQLGRGEPIRDTARVLGRMIHGAVIRTYAQRDVMDFAHLSGIPTINALTDDEHPCQIMADLQTMQERLGGYAGKIVTFVGDGACNVPISWLWAAAKLGFELRIAAPRAFQPAPEVIARAFPGAKTPAPVGDGAQAVYENDRGGRLLVTENIDAAATGADVLYTDVWVSMGKEDEAAYRAAQFARYQINAELVARAKPGVLVMHCLPAYRGKEITEEVLEAHADTIFTQSENRLHAQKAILSLVAR